MLYYSCIGDEREKKQWFIPYIYLFYTAAVDVLFFSRLVFLQNYEIHSETTQSINCEPIYLPG